MTTTEPRSALEVLFRLLTAPDPKVAGGASEEARLAAAEGLAPRLNQLDIDPITGHGLPFLSRDAAIAAIAKIARSSTNGLHRVRAARALLDAGIDLLPEVIS